MPNRLRLLPKFPKPKPAAVRVHSEWGDRYRRLDDRDRRMVRDLIEALERRRRGRMLTASALSCA